MAAANCAIVPARGGLNVVPSMTRLPAVKASGPASPATVTVPIWFWFATLVVAATPPAPTVTVELKVSDALAALKVRIFPVLSSEAVTP